MFLYLLGVQSLRLFKARYYSFPGRLHLDSSGTFSAIRQLLCEECSFTYPPLSIARCSFIQLNELKQRGINEIAEALKRQQENSG